MATFTVGPNSDFPTISAAMAAVGPGDILVLAPGYSNETATVLHDGMTIVGGSGSTGIVLELAMGVANVTLDGEAPFTLLDAADGQGIVGNDGDNLITVTAGADAVSGGLGEDRLIVDYRLATGAITGDSTSNVAESGGGARLVTITSGFEHVTVWTGSGADTITTAGGDDDIRTGEGASTVVAGEGSNYIVGGSGADTITAGDGGNYVDGGDGANIITTGAGVDQILSGMGADTIVTGGGNDRITIRGGGDTANAGGGADLVIVDYASAITDVAGGVVSGDLASGYVGHIADLSLATLDFEGVERFWITTGSGADLVTTGDGADILVGNAGDDGLSAAGGNDQLYGGLGLDDLVGGLGYDLLDGGVDADQMAGGLGDDIYFIDNANDVATEAVGAGGDIVRATVTVTLGDNIETLVLQGVADIGGTGNAGANILNGNAGSNVLDGGAGADLIKGGAGDDDLNGGTGGDQLLGGIGADDLDGADDNDRLEGGDGDDVILGGSGNDILDGGSDNDSLNGGTGADQLLGGAGTDTLDGGAGNDTLNGGLGADAMTGGIGDDIFFVDDAGDTTSEALGEGVDQVRTTISHTLADNIETLTLQGVGNLTGTGNGLANTLNGNDGNNTLDGAAGVDLLKGGHGEDTLIGGTGADILVGGTGADGFAVRQESLYSSLAPAGRLLEVDTISDFSTLDGDIIDLSAIDAIDGGGDDAFALVGAFNGAAGQMTLSFGAGITTLRLDADGDGLADYMVKINGDVRADSGGWAL